MQADIEELRHAPDLFDGDQKPEGTYVAETGPQGEEAGACVERRRNISAVIVESP
jgi:hypothetical protein